jgi:hypothetical protein
MKIIKYFNNINQKKIQVFPSELRNRPCVNSKEDVLRIHSEIVGHLPANSLLLLEIRIQLKFLVQMRWNLSCEIPNDDFVCENRPCEVYLARTKGYGFHKVFKIVIIIVRRLFLLAEPAHRTEFDFWRTVMAGNV